MSFDVDSPELPRRSVAAHQTIATLAVAGAVGVQASWMALVDSESSGWGPYIVAVVLATTAWLLATGWLHGRMARRVGPSRRALVQVVGDIAVVIVAATILSQGHASAAASAGLWLIPPALLAIGATSAVVLAIAALTASNQPGESSIGLDAWRIAIVIGLFASLGLLVAKPFH